MGFCVVTKDSFFNKVNYKRVHINLWSLSSLHFLILYVSNETSWVERNHKAQKGSKNILYLSMCIDVSWHIKNVSCCKTFEYQEEIVSDIKYVLQINIIYKNAKNIFLLLVPYIVNLLYQYYNFVYLVSILIIV